MEVVPGDGSALLFWGPPCARAQSASGHAACPSAPHARTSSAGRTHGGAMEGGRERKGEREGKRGGERGRGMEGER